MIDRDSSLVTVPWTPALDMQRAMIANALSIVGFHGGDIATRTPFQSLLGPPYRWPLRVPFRQWVDEDGKIQTEGVSTCAMVALGLLRRLAVDCKNIRDGYDVGSGLGVAIAYARSVHAWQDAIAGLRPPLGAIVQVTPMHVAIVIGHRGSVIDTVEGGQVHPRDGLQCVAKCSRTYYEDTHTLGARRALGWIDVALLRYRGAIVVPKGWDS